MEKSKVFCLGLNKTGTSTLGSCYTILGYKQQGYSLEFSREYFQSGFSPLIQEVINKNDAFQDFPWPLMWKEVVGLYPDAKFVLTTRLTPEIWYKSECKHVARTPHSREVNKLVYGSDTPEICEKSI